MDAFGKKSEILSCRFPPSHSTENLLPAGHHHDTSTTPIAGANSPSVSSKADLTNLETTSSVVSRMHARRKANPRPTSTIEYGIGYADGGIYVGPDESSSATELRNAWMIGLQPPAPDHVPQPLNRQDSSNSGARNSIGQHVTQSTDTLPTTAITTATSPTYNVLLRHSSSTTSNTGTNTPAGTAASTLRKNESIADPKNRGKQNCPRAVDAACDCCQRRLLAKARLEVVRVLKQEGVIVFLTQEMKEEIAQREELEREVKELTAKLEEAVAVEEQSERSLRVEDKQR
ncbi:hypothetical protein BC830DRAFT_1084605 [Chytriomyces sp. MP71]|nr:hypothetical protein BC830DRAFT_1084605 [Chytriomyces sp. MP71]